MNQCSKKIATACAGLLLLVACGDNHESRIHETEPASGDTPAQAAPSAPQEASSAGGPPPLTSRSQVAPETLDGSAIVAPGAVFDLPAAWRSETPTSSMRLAQAAIPGEAGDGQLTVFYFGPGGGGGVEANLQRWVGQIDATGEPSRQTFDQGAFRVTWLEVEGTLKPSTMGVGPTEPQPGSRMLGAVVEGAEGPWFFKATGPADTLEGERDNFLSMLRSARQP